MSGPTDTPPSAHEWIAAFARDLGVEAPDADTMDRLLALAGVAAHASERIAAPIACYLVGRAGTDLATAQHVAEAVEP